MKRLTLLFLSVLVYCSATAQKKNFTYDFYGFVRGDLFYNSRANQAPVDGNFYLYPLDKQPDAEGNDLNATPNGSFYTFTTRLGINMTGPNIGSARSSACIETDFGGFSNTNTMLRIRQAWVALNWEKTQVLIGQTWHPLFGSVMPDVLNLSTGAPYQPFNRSPLIRLQQRYGKMTWTAAAIWQLQYTSNGPNGKSEDYIKNSCVPEIYVGGDFVSGDGWLIGAGAHLISLKPRTSSEVDGNIYKVDERMTTYSYEAHLKYTARNFSFATKSMMASALDHMAMLSGYGVSGVDERTGKQSYTPFRHSTTWANVTYGTKWKGGLFLGYTKNLGTDDALTASKTVYGMGLNIDQLFTVNVNLSYNLPHWQFGVEYCPATAWYGTTDQQSGRVRDTHTVTNHRILGLAVYKF